VPQPDEKSLRYFSDGALAPFSSSSMGDPKVHQSREVHTRSIGQWRRQLSDEEIISLLSVLGPRLFERLGYNDVSDELRRRGLPSPDEGATQALRLARQRQNWDEVTKLRGDLANSERHTADMLNTLNEFQDSHNKLLKLTSVREREQKRLKQELVVIRADAARCLDALSAQDRLIIELRRDVAERQGEIDRLNEQVDQLGLSIADQNRLISRLTQENTRLSDEATAFKEERKATYQESQKHIDHLLGQLTELTEVSRVQAAETQGRVDALLQQLNELAATSAEQDQFISVLKEERDRLAAAESEHLREIKRLVDIVSEQTAYLELLRQSQPAAKRVG
jgi:chromosome segregation ATPase